MSFEVVRAQPADVDEAQAILEGVRQWLLSAMRWAVLSEIG
jgi:hypothetical protein